MENVIKDQHRRSTSK